jgi:two-component system sensor histidine kinase UhpB
MQLILDLVARLVGVTLVCLAVTVGWVMADAHRAVEAETAASADRVTRDLEHLYWREILWRGSMRRDKILPTPNWESLDTLRVISPGVCITVAPGSQEPRSLCSQVEGVGTAAPEWFAGVYDAFFGQPKSITRSLTIRQPEVGVVTVAADPAAAVRQAWRQTTVVLGVAASMAIGICLLAVLSIAHVLAPARTIVEGLRRLEKGEYGHRLPAYGTAEFGHIARAVNDLTARLATTTAERLALTKRLFEVQEEERRALARDLHDEFGQCLTATLAFAASIEAGAAAERPDLAQDARSISGVVKRMMVTLREALARLRSQDLDELGLEASLAQLVAGWNAQAAPKAVFHLDLSGDLAGVPRAIAMSVYRIAQECLTNAARHGKPSDVYLRVARISSAGGAVSLTVEDNGGGDPSRISTASGHGILGIRERIAASGGSLAIGRAARGVRVAATIPLLAPISAPTMNAGLA